MTLLPDCRIPVSAEAATPEAEAQIDVGRRAALKGLAGGLAAALATPPGSTADAHPIGAHIVQRAERKAVPAPRATAPKFLDAHQFATLALVADLIVPGASASGSPRFIDEVLAIERHDIQRRFVQALGAIDAAARDQHQRAFRDLPRDRQVALLEDAARQPPGRSEPAAAHQPQDSLAEGQARTGLREPFDHLKTWIAGAHYSSEAGMKELGWTGAMFFAAFPGCTHPEGHE